MNEPPREARSGDSWLPVPVEAPPAAPALVRALVVFGRGAAALAVVLGAAALVGWATHTGWLEDPVPGFVPMLPNTAVMLIASGVALLLCGPAAASRRRARVGRALAAACLALATTTVAQDILGVDLGIDTLLFAAQPARPAVPTSIALVLASVAILLLDVAPRRGPRPAEVLALAVTVLASLTLGGYAYGAIQFYVSQRHPHAVGMAISTAVALLALAAGIAAARPAVGAMAILTSPLVGSQVARRMLLLALAIPAVGLVAARLQNAQVYEPPGAAVVSSVAGVVAVVLITLTVGRSLNRADLERRRKEAALREWKRFFDSARFGTAVGRLDGTLGWVNECFAHEHGYTVDELVGAPIVRVFPPHRHAELAENIRLTHEHGHARWESEHLRKDGSVFPARIDLSAVRDDQGRLLYRAACVQDITGEKKAEVERARLASLVQSADDAIVAKTLDGVVLDWNRGAERVYGFTAEEMVGRSITAIVPEDRRAEREAIRAQVLHGEMVVGFETERVRKDGRRICIALTLSPIRDAAGQVVGVSTIERDITLQKQTEAELRTARALEIARAEDLGRANADLTREIAERRRTEEALRASLREKDVLIKEVHHRVKNNLQVITSLLDLQARHLGDPRSRDVLRESQSRVRSIALVHEKIYQSTDLGSIDFGAYLDNLVRSLVAMYDAPARGIAVDVHSADVRLGIDTAMHCGLIVNELVSNAFKHAFPRGRAGRVQVALRRDGDMLVLAVTDDGVGFPEGIDFRNTPSLGLQLVCSLCDQLGGSLTATRGAGAEIAIRFPAQPRALG